MPIEFVRKSGNGRITLVISAKAAPVTVLWAELAVRFDHRFTGESTERMRIAAAEVLAGIVPVTFLVS